MTEAARQLVERATRVEVACDLEIGLPARAPSLADAAIEACSSGELAHAPPRALWNVLWLAADLTTHVDVFRALELLSAVERLFVAHLPSVLQARGERSEAAEMAFDFFFNRAQQPLALKLPQAIEALGRVLAVDNRFCRRAALHGLGHLVGHAGARDRARIEALIDELLARTGDGALADYARAARSGEVL
jgi:hypothetical protein